MLATQPHGAREVQEEWRQVMRQALGPRGGVTPQDTEGIFIGVHGVCV